MLGKGENRIYEIEPYLHRLCQIASVDVGVVNGFSPLPLAQTVYHLPDDLLKLSALLELVVLCAFIHRSQLQELGDGPFPKRDPPPSNIARQVLLFAQIGVEFFDYSLYSWLPMLAQLLPTSSLDLFLKCRYQLLSTSFLHKSFLGQMFLEHFCSLVRV